MKVGLAIIATVNAKALEGERSTDTLMNMLINYNPDFDARKYFLYGCNCIVSGDRPLVMRQDSGDLLILWMLYANLIRTASNAYNGLMAKRVLPDQIR